MGYYIKTVICIVFILLQYRAVFAAPVNNTLQGVITDDKGAPLAGVAVAIPDLKLGTISAANGNYVLNQLPEGIFLVQVKMLGFATLTRYITIKNDAKQDFRLMESIIERSEIVITGTSHATEERRSVTPIQSIRMRELRENAFTNIADAIAKLPGVSQVSTGPAISKPIIRGLGANRIITLNDGIRQEGQQWGDEHGIEIDDYNVSRIEVLKGPASIAYGSDALAGVINIISDEPLPVGRIEGTVAASYQGNSGLGALHAGLGGNIKGYSWNVYGTGKQAHDYKNTYDGYVFNSRFKNVNYGATIGIDKKWGYSRLAFTSFGQTLGIPEGERDSATGSFTKAIDKDGIAETVVVTNEEGKLYNRELPAQRIDHHKIVWNNNLYLQNNGRLGLILGYQQNSRKEFADVLQPDEAGLSFLLRTYNYDVKYFFPTWDGWQVTSGINGMLQNNTNRGVEFLIPDYDLFDVGVYAIAKKDWQKWSVSGGIRYNYRTLDVKPLYLDSTDKRVMQEEPGGNVQFASFRRTFSNAVGSIGASYSLSKKLSLKLNIASGFRSPNAAELSANGVHEGTIRYEYGNQDLDAESSLQADLGMSWNSEHIALTAAVFYNYISNYIYLQKLFGTSGTDSIPAMQNSDGLTAYRYTQNNAGLYGGELFVDFHPHPLDWLHFENTISYVRGVRFNGIDSTRYLPAMPPARWSTALKAQKRTITKWLSNAYAKISVDVIFAQHEVLSAYSTETTTPAYTLLHAGMGFDCLNKVQKTLCSISLSVQNITGAGYQDHLSRLKYAAANNVTGRQGIYNMGRNISLLVVVPIRVK